MLDTLHLESFMIQDEIDHAHEDHREFNEEELEKYIQAKKHSKELLDRVIGRIKKAVDIIK